MTAAIPDQDCKHFTQSNCKHADAYDATAALMIHTFFRPLSRSFILVHSIAALLVIVSVGHAANSWDGEMDGLWSSTANWDDNVVPLNDASLTFGGFPTENTITNNDALTSVGAITFDSAATAAFTLSGNAVTLGGNIFNNSPSLSHTISLNLTLSGDRIVNSGTGGLTISGNITGTAATGATQQFIMQGNAGTVSGAFSTGINGGSMRIRLDAAIATDTWSLLGPSISTLATGQLNVKGGIFNFGDGSDSPSLTISAPTVPANGEALIIGADGSQGGSMPGVLNMKSGSLTVAAANIGNSTNSSVTGTFNQTGGTFTVSGSGASAGTVFGANRNSGTLKSQINVSGGTFIATAMSIATRGIGELNVSGTGVVQIPTLRLTHTGSTPGATAQGTVNLNGGTLIVGSVAKGTGTNANAAVFNFNGGKLKASAASVNFMTGLNFANVNAGGAVIDSNGFDITIGQALLDGGSGGGLAKSGIGTLTLSAANTYTGTTAIDNGTLALASTGSINNSTMIRVGATGTLNVTAASAFTLQSGQILTGTGTVSGGTIAGLGSTVSPGESPGILNVGDITLAGGTLALEIFGTTPGISQDQLRVTGNISLTADTPITIDLGGFDPVDDGSQSFMVVDNAGSNPVNTSGGLFTYNATPLAEGDVFIAGVQEFRISYVGGTSNDVVLTAVPEPGTGIALLGALGILFGRRRHRGGYSFN